MKNFFISIVYIILHVIYISLICLSISSCGINHVIPIETIIQYKDSTITNVIDSTVFIPVERYIDIVNVYDTLYLQTSKAKAEAYVDTTYRVLKGKIENKSGIEYKYIYKDRIEYKDSIITKEVPVYIDKEIVKYKHYWYEKFLWVFFLLFLIPLIIKLLRGRLCLIKE